MAIENLSEQVLLVTLPKRPQTSSDINRATHVVTAQEPRHVIIDFSQVEVMSSSTISELIIIENHLHELDRQLVLCSAPRKIRELIKCVGLESLFRFADNQFSALEMLSEYRYLGA
ncbi:MAG: STAS domain-containing protein [Sedimentisphaerales bacterium]|nr:STAS domain-containing protein [Sedimentisphaerales bacterium]